MQPGVEQGILPPGGNATPQKRAGTPFLRPSSMTTLTRVLKKVQVRLKMKGRIPMRRTNNSVVLSTKWMERRKEGIKCSKMHEICHMSIFE